MRQEVGGGGGKGEVQGPHAILFHHTKVCVCVWGGGVQGPHAILLHHTKVCVCVGGGGVQGPHAILLHHTKVCVWGGGVQGPHAILLHHTKFYRGPHAILSHHTKGGGYRGPKPFFYATQRGPHAIPLSGFQAIPSGNLFQGR